MAVKHIILNDGTKVVMSKRRNSRSIRLTVASDGTVKVTLPTWTPYAAGQAFVQSKAAWIAAHIPKSGIFIQGQAVGKAHRFEFVPSTASHTPSGRVVGQSVRITHPSTLQTTDPLVQAAAERTAIRALRAQAEQLLPVRLRDLAERYGFSYSSISIKQLKGRWGSCDSNKAIVLNLYLMQLPWELIDYVILHELTHTVVLRHGPDFWSALARVDSKVDNHRKAIRAYQPTLIRSEPEETVA